MKILAIEKQVSGVTAEQFNPYLKAEAARAWELYQAGVFRELYFRADRSDAVLVLECTEVEEARHALDTLPLVKEGLITFDLIPLRPYPGFARLFATEPQCLDESNEAGRSGFSARVGLQPTVQN